jgi:molybdopterin converting factor small subunit
MKVLFFANTRELAGCSSIELEPSGPMTEEALWDWLGGRFPALAPMKNSTRLARNGVWLSRGELLEPGDEVAVLPPVSGG